MIQFGDILRVYRTMRGMTQNAVALKSDLAMDTINRWEAGRDPAWSDAMRVCAALGLEPNDFLESRLESKVLESAKMYAEARRSKEAKRKKKVSGEAIEQSQLSDGSATE